MLHCCLNGFLPSISRVQGLCRTGFQPLEIKVTYSFGESGTTCPARQQRTENLDYKHCENLKTGTLQNPKIIKEN
jgi:hypothetical protein